VGIEIAFIESIENKNKKLTKEKTFNCNMKTKKENKIRNIIFEGNSNSW
jgi:hypothetical protein